MIIITDNNSDILTIIGELNVRDDYTMVGKVHKNSLDLMTPSQIRVVVEHLLSTMEVNQRNDLRNTFPGLYKMIYPEVKNG